MNGLEAVALLQLHEGSGSPSINDWAQVLTTFPLFSGVSKRQLRKLVRSASVAELARGETVIAKGDSSDSL